MNPVATDDSPRTPQAAALSVLIHGLVAGGLVAYFWMHPFVPPTVSHTFEIFSPPAGPADDVEPSPSPAPSTGTASLAQVNFSDLKLPPVPTPPTPTPPAQTSPAPTPTPAPTPATPATNRGSAPSPKAPDSKQIDLATFRRQNQPPSSSASSRQTGPSSPARTVPNVGISNSASKAIQNMAQGGRGSATTASRGSQEYNNYQLRLAALLRDAFELPQGASGLKANVQLTIAANGKVLEGKITRKSGNPAFDTAVQAALDSLKFVDPPPGGRDDSFAFVFTPEG